MRLAYQHDLQARPVYHRTRESIEAHLTVGRLADWLDRARSVGTVDDQPIGLEATDSEGNPIAVGNVFVELDQ